MTLLKIGRCIVDNDLSFFIQNPKIIPLFQIPVLFTFPGRKITLQYPYPLHLAVYLNRPEIVRFILSQGIDPDSIHKPTGYSALHLAALLNDGNMIDLLVEHNANVNIVGRDGDTPLHVAAYDGHFDAVYRLIVHGADINAYSNGDDSKTPLNYALYQNHRPVIAYLVKNGADRSHLDFRNVPYREEMIQFVNEGYLDDEYDAEKLVSRACTGRIEDVLDFEYPQCVEIDPRKRYTNQEYIKEVIDRNQQNTDKSTDEKDHQDTKDDHDDQDHKDPKDDQDNHGIAFL